MTIRFVSLAVVAAMVIGLGSTSVFAGTGSDPKKPVADKTSSTSVPAAKDETKQDEKLKVEVLKLVADTKAGKLAPLPQSQFPNTKRNNLSTGAKIGIVAAIGGAIFLIILFHDLSKD